MPRPGPWAGRTFDDPEVIAAYLDWCRDLLDRFQPRYFNYAIESSELFNNAPEKWPALMTLLRAVYPVLKREYPRVLIFVSITLRDPGTPEMIAARPAIEEVMQVSDMMTVSSYRYIFGAGADKGNPATLPPDWLSQAADIAPDRPFAVAETGWAAETLNVPDYGLYVPSSPAWQNDYVTRLFTDAEALHARFIIWFLAVDYDNLYWWMSQWGQAGPSWLLWKDTGLWDGSVNPRPSLANWESWKARPRVTVPPPVPDGAAWGGTALRVDALSGGDLRVSWDSTSCPAPGYHLLWFDLGALPDLTAIDEICNAGVSGSWSGAPPAGSALGVIVAADDGGAIEGSHGFGRDGRGRGSAALRRGGRVKLRAGEGLRRLRVAREGRGRGLRRRHFGQFRALFLDQVRASLDGIMHREVRQIQEKWPLLVLFYVV